MKSKHLCYLLVLTVFKVHAQAVDNCVNNVELLLAKAADDGITQPLNTSISGLIQDCEAALQQNPQSTSLRLNLARSLTWAGRESSALIQLEMLLGTDKEPEALNIATALCAHDRGGNAVVAQTCEWSADSGISSPALAERAAKNMLNTGKPEIGLRFMAQAAQNGSSSAQKYVSDLCTNYTPNGSNTFSSLPGQLTSLDPIFVAATACEAAFQSASQDQKNWSSHGFKYAEAMTFFDDYESAAKTLLLLAQSNDATVAGGAIDVLDSLCTATAGDPNDPDFGNDGISDAELLPDRAQPVCEAAAFVWPDNGRLHYNLARIYSTLGPNEQTTADEALEEASRLGYSLAKNVVSSAPVKFDINQFNEPNLIKAFYNQDMKLLNQEPYFAMVYAMGLHSVFSQDNVLFLGENARDILLEVDATLSYKASLKLTDPNLFKDALYKGAQTFLEPIIGMAEYSNRPDASFVDGARVYQRNILSTPLVQADVLKQKAEQDGRRLAILYETNQDDFRKVYAGLKNFIEQ